MRAYVGEADHWHGKPLALSLLQMLHDEGAAGATVLRGVAGFGAHGRIHVGTLVDIASPLPLIVEWIDTPERVDRLLPRFCEMVAQGLVTVETVQLVRLGAQVPD